MRRALAAIAALTLLAGCGPSYDEDGYALVTEWADAQVGATEAVMLIDPDDESERRDAAERIEQANAEYWERDDWPSADEVEGWGINMTQGDRTWVIEGSELWPAVDNLEDTSGWLAEQLKGDDAQELEWAWEDAQMAVEDLRAVLTGS